MLLSHLVTSRARRELLRLLFGEEARVLPLVLWRHRETLDHDELVRQMSARNERQAFGFFLELGGDPEP